MDFQFALYGASVLKGFLKCVCSWSPESVVDRAMVSCGVVALMLVVGLCLWWIHKQSKIIEEKSKGKFES